MSAHPPRGSGGYERRVRLERLQTMEGLRPPLGVGSLLGGVSGSRVCLASVHAGICFDDSGYVVRTRVCLASVSFVRGIAAETGFVPVMSR